MLALWCACNGQNDPECPEGPSTFFDITTASAVGHDARLEGLSSDKLESVMKAARRWHGHVFGLTSPGVYMQCACGHKIQVDVHMTEHEARFDAKTETTYVGPLTAEDLDLVRARWRDQLPACPVARR